MKAYSLKNKKIMVLITILICLFPVEVMCQDLFEEAVREKTAFADFSYDINGYFRSDLWVGKEPGADTAEVKTLYGEAAFQLRIRDSETADAYTELRLRPGYVSTERGTGLDEGRFHLDYSSKNFETVLDLREAYINAYIGPMDFRLGHQIIVWGRADGINPTDNLIPHDMRICSPEEDDRRMANFGIRTYYNFYPFRLEGIWLPFFAESHFPDFNLSSNIIMSDEDYPDTDLRYGIEAVRLHYIVPAFEFSASYLIGSSTYPGIAFKSREASQTILELKAYRHQVIGMDFATTMDEYGLRGEMAYCRPFDHKSNEYAPSPDLRYIIGIDREFFQELSIIVQYIGCYVFDWSASQDKLPGAIRETIIQKNRMISEQIERVQHGATLRAEWKLWQETLKLEALLYTNFTTEEWMVRPKISYDITDTLKITFGGELFLGPGNTLYGTIDETQSAVYAELKKSF